MDRRDFMKNVIRGGVVAGCALAFGGGTGFAATVGAPAGAAFDLVAVRGGRPGAMFDRAMASLGGMQAYVPKGSRVLVKPNIGWGVGPERGGNTNPELVGRIVEHCLQAGAKEVSVFDHTCDPWAQCYRSSGIERAVRDAGGKMASGNSEGYYQRVAVPGGKRLREAMVHELLLEADVFINAPVLKHHSSTQLTIGMKNLMGVVWDRGYWHRNDLHQCIADFSSYRRPTLTVVDAYNVMLRNGPRGVSEADIVQMQALVVSPDPVAADTAAAMLFGAEPADIPYIRLAAEMNLGRMDLSALSIDRIRL